MKTYFDDGTVKIRSMAETDAKIIYDTYDSYRWHPQLKTYEDYYKEQEAGERFVFIAEYEGSGVWYKGKQLGQYEPCCNDDDLLLFMSKELLVP